MFNKKKHNKLHNEVIFVKPKTLKLFLVMFTRVWRNFDSTKFCSFKTLVNQMYFVVHRLSSVTWQRYNLYWYNNRYLFANLIFISFAEFVTEPIECQTFDFWIYYETFSEEQNWTLFFTLFFINVYWFNDTTWLKIPWKIL